VLRNQDEPENISCREKVLLQPVFEPVVKPNLRFPTFERSLSAATFATLRQIIVKRRADDDDGISGVS